MVIRRRSLRRLLALLLLGLLPASASAQGGAKYLRVDACPASDSALGPGRGTARVFGQYTSATDSAWFSASADGGTRIMVNVRRAGRMPGPVYAAQLILIVSPDKARDAMQNEDAGILRLVADDSLSLTLGPGLRGRNLGQTRHIPFTWPISPATLRALARAHTVRAWFGGRELKLPRKTEHMFADEYQAALCFAAPAHER